MHPKVYGRRQALINTEASAGFSPVRAWSTFTHQRFKQLPHAPEAAFRKLVRVHWSDRDVRSLDVAHEEAEHCAMTTAAIGKTSLRLVTGDIAEQDTDAVVTAAHYRLNKGAGTDGTIHTRGGPAIYEECRIIGGCPIGDAVITTGGNLKARYVIHAVGPVWRGGDEDEPRLLASAYRRSLEIAAERKLRSIAFPSISTGAFVYPMRLAAPIALTTIIEFLRNGEHALEEVRIVLYTREDEGAHRIFADELERIMSSAS